MQGSRASVCTAAQLCRASSKTVLLRYKPHPVARLPCCLEVLRCCTQVTHAVALYWLASARMTVNLNVYEYSSPTRVVLS
jgi:hypothetical protein